MKPPIMNNTVYDVIKWSVSIVLPAIGTLYYSISEIWGIPGGENVVSTITAICLFLGTCMGISNYAYANSDDRYDGTLNVRPNEGKDTYSLELVKTPEELRASREISFKVQAEKAVGNGKTEALQ